MGQVDLTQRVMIKPSVEVHIPGQPVPRIDNKLKPYQIMTLGEAMEICSSSVQGLGLDANVEINEEQRNIRFNYMLLNGMVCGSSILIEYVLLG